MLSKMQQNILFFFACLNFGLTSWKDLWTKVAAMRRKGVIFSIMFILRSMGHALVPSPLKSSTVGIKTFRPQTSPPSHFIPGLFASKIEPGHFAPRL